MDFRNFLDEMTMSYGKMQDFPFPDFSDAQHVGDIEHSKILYKQLNGLDIYAITADDTEKPVCYIQTQPQNIQGMNFLNINFVQTLPEFRGKNFAKKLVFFIKTHLKQHLLFGDRQSRLGQIFIQSIAKTKRFDMFWINVKTGEQHPYDYEKDHFSLHPYRGLGDTTDWQIMIESLQSTKQEQFLNNPKDQWKRYLVLFD